MDDFEQNKRVYVIGQFCGRERKKILKKLCLAKRGFEFLPQSPMDKDLRETSSRVEICDTETQLS